MTCVVGGMDEARSVHVIDNTRSERHEEGK